MNKTLRQFEKTIEEISDLEKIHTALLLEPIHDGKWSIREIIGHLYYWDKYNLEKMVPKMSEGAKLPSFPDHDQQNKEAIVYFENHSIESIIDDFIKTRKKLIEALLSLDDEVRFIIGTSKRQFSGESFIKIFIKHDAHHLQQINEKVNSKK